MVSLIVISDNNYDNHNHNDIGNHDANHNHNHNEINYMLCHAHTIQNIQFNSIQLKLFVFISHKVITNTFI